MSLETTTTSNKVVSRDTPDGVVEGQLSTGKVGFYGTAPIVQPTAAGQAIIVDTSGGTATAATGITTITATYNSTILANAIATLAVQTNAIRLALVNLGLIKGS